MPQWRDPGSVCSFRLRPHRVFDQDLARSTHPLLWRASEKLRSAIRSTRDRRGGVRRSRVPVASYLSASSANGGTRNKKARNTLARYFSYRNARRERATRRDPWRRGVARPGRYSNRARLPTKGLLRANRSRSSAEHSSDAASPRRKNPARNINRDGQRQSFRDRRICWPCQDDTRDIFPYARLRCAYLPYENHAPTAGVFPANRAWCVGRASLARVHGNFRRSRLP